MAKSSTRAGTKPIGVLIGQLGTPDAPTATALRPYLAQFLSDRRVIDYSPFYWQPILRGAILPRRPKRSARLYQRIWTEKGSPLLTYSNAQVEGLQERLGDDYRVILGMRYGNPSIHDAIKQLESEGIDRIIVLPMFPQYSSTTTASIYDATYEAAAGRHGQIFNDRKRFIPTLRFVEPYYDHPDYINAMKIHLQEVLQGLEHAPDKILVTFHGILNRYVETGDPYREQCETTARLLADAMDWTNDEWMIGFQSRFGREPWLEPYVDEVITAFHSQHIERPLVFSPGFTTDCLETIDELGNEGREQFEDGGGHGENYRLAACLNGHPAFLDMLTNMIRDNAGGWVAPHYHPEVANAAY